MSRKSPAIIALGMLTWLWSQCDPGFVDLDGYCYWEDDLAVLQEFIDNSGDSLNMNMDDNDNGIIEPLELGFQEWESGRLVELGCYYKGISGPLPESAGTLTQLTSLNLGANQLTGSIPDSLGNLTELVYLYLNANFLEGNIPASLGDLSQLVHLYLHDNQLTGAIPPELGDLYSLERLNLSNNQLAGYLPPELGELTALMILYLQNNDFLGSIPAEWGEMVNLTELLINDNNVGGYIPGEINGMISLEVLWLQNNLIIGADPEICELPMDWYQVDCGDVPFFLMGNNYMCSDIPECMENATFFNYVWNEQFYYSEYVPQNCDWYYPGDVNMDDQVDVNDVVYMVSIIIAMQQPTGFEIVNGDLTGDQSMDILDIVQLVDMILN